jgi:hypothetical protein
MIDLGDAAQSFPCRSLPSSQMISATAEIICEGIKIYESSQREFFYLLSRIEGQLESIGCGANWTSA